MEAARSHVLLPSRRAKRPRTLDDQLLLLRPQIQIPSRGAKRRRPHLRAWAWGAKRARTALSRHGSLLPCPNKWRNWANLADGPAGLIAERVLANDVADYVRFRAVCRPWRRCAAEPRAHGGLDRRFHPRRWTMLREKLAAPHRRCFLNTSTGECIQVDLPELRDHEVLALTPEEGLLVLLHHHQRTNVRLLNPLTRHLIELPPLTTLLPPDQHDKPSDDNIRSGKDFAAWGSGIANDDCTVVLCFHSLHMLGMAKPGDEHWALLNYAGDPLTTAPLMFAGRFYCVTMHGVMVLETSSDRPPCFEVAAKLCRRVSPMADTMHLVNNGGELMLVHRRFWPLTNGDNSRRRYDAYRVDLDTGTLFPVKSLGGGRAMFMGMHCSLSVSLEVFPSGSISGDTIYLSFDVGERVYQLLEAYHLADGSIKPSNYNLDGSVARPHTLVDCLSLSNTVRRTIPFP